MQTKRLVLIFSALTITVIAALKLLTVSAKSENIQLNISTHKVKFFDENFFYGGLKAQSKTQVTSTIKGGVVPHHLFAGDLISEFFDGIKNNGIETVILIGPNHYEKGEIKAISSRYGWETKIGAVMPDLEKINELERSGLVGINEAVIVNEHSVSGLMPYIMHYLQKAKVVPIILSSYYSYEELKPLAVKLSEVMDEKTIIIASVDFSHNLKSSQAADKDIKTLKAIKNKDIEQILSFNNSHLDSGPSIALLIETMEKKNVKNLKILKNTNSGLMQDNSGIETTSYITHYYY